MNIFLGGGNSYKYEVEHTCRNSCIIAPRDINMDMVSDRKINENYSYLKCVLINRDIRPVN